MNQVKLLVLILLPSLIGSSCYRTSKNLKEALNKAGENRAELEKVLEHFKDNQQKYKAVCFLIENMDTKYSIGKPCYTSYRDTINKYYQNVDSLETILRTCRCKKEKILDITNIKADFLIKDIEHAFYGFEHSKWHNEISYNTFIEYILPYRLGNEELENWRSNILSKPDSVTLNYDDLVSAATYLIQQQSVVKKDFVVRWGDQNPRLIDIPYSLLSKLPVGTCDELSYYIAFVLRAYSIPCAVDFTPNFSNHNTGHSWNAIILDSGESIPFVFPLKHDTLRRYKSDRYTIAKVFRETYFKVPQNHATLRGKRSFLPKFLGKPNIIDVTDKYIQTQNIETPIIGSENLISDFAYISVFNGKNWIPVDWGKVYREKAKFKKVGVKNVYLPVAIEEKSTYALNYPFILTESGQVHFLKPNMDSLISLEIKRKFPLKSTIQMFIDRMIGGEFQGANKPDFSDVVTLHKIEKSPGEYYNDIKISNDNEFRYVRYQSGRESSCNVAELEFYSNTNNKPLKGKIIGTEGSYDNNPKRTRGHVFDGDVLTFFDAPVTDSAWVGMDFGSKQPISKIRFIARTDYNIIVPENVYEVFYWDYDHWKSLGKQIAASNTLKYDNVPSNCLYFILNYTSGKEVRIFTYEDGKQVWW